MKFSNESDILYSLYEVHEQCQLMKATLPEVTSEADEIHLLQVLKANNMVIIINYIRLLSANLGDDNRVI